MCLIRKWEETRDRTYQAKEGEGKQRLAGLHEAVKKTCKRVAEIDGTESDRYCETAGCPAAVASQ
jgi:hypothetical protein